MEKIVLVDKDNKEIGTCEKLKVHKEGILHRAFSIFIFNSKGELLIQRRSKNKYHSGGLWTNTCCGHQRENEILIESAHRRLKEEMGFDCETKEVFRFIYKTKFENGLYEIEYDHVFTGNFDREPKPNSGEIESVRWIPIKKLKEDIKKTPEKYSFWIKIILEKYSVIFSF